MNFQDVKKYAKLSFLAKQLVDGFITGLHKSPYHGFSVEFSEYLLYNSGESTRNIDWKVFVRTDKLFVKRYEEETNLRCMILLDTSSSMFYPSPKFDKLRFSALAAACLTYLLNQQRDAVGLTTFSEDMEKSTLVRSSTMHLKNIISHLQSLYDQTQAPKKQKKTAIAQILHKVAENIHKRSLVIILSDMLENTQDSDDIFSALQHLRHNKHEVLILHIFDNNTEIEFDFAEMPIQFIDKETGLRQKAFPSQIRERYQRIIREKLKEIRLRCGRYKIDFVPVHCRDNIQKVLIPYLAKRSKING